MYKIKRFSSLKESSYSFPITKMAYGLSKPFSKNKIKLGRNLISKENKSKSFLYEASSNPGSVVAKGVKEASRNPVTGGLVTGGNIVAPVIPGVTEGALAVGKPIDNLLRKKLPKVYKTSEKVGGKLAPIAEGITNSVVNYAKMI